jgi:hypothetical protein
MTSDWQRSPWHCRSCKSQILHSRKCTPSFRHPCLGSAFWFKTGISEVNSRMQKNLRLVPSVANLHHSFKIAVGRWHFLPSVSLNSVGV